MSALYGRRQVPHIAPLKWRVALREHYARATLVARGAQSVNEVKVLDFVLRHLAELMFHH